MNNFDECHAIIKLVLPQMKSNLYRVVSYIYIYIHTLYIYTHMHTVWWFVKVCLRRNRTVQSDHAVAGETQTIFYNCIGIMKPL